MEIARKETRNLINDDNATLDAAMTAAGWAAEHLKDGAVWVDRLQRAGLDSGVAKALSSHVFAYAWPTLLKKIHTREIIEDCKARFKRTLVDFTSSEREVLRSSRDQRATLAVGTMLAAIDPFLEAVYAGRWESGYASLPSFFVGACINHFPGTFKKWRDERQELLVGLASDATLQLRTPVDSPFERVELDGHHPDHPRRLRHRHADDVRDDRARLYPARGRCAPADVGRRGQPAAVAAAPACLGSGRPGPHHAANPKGTPRAAVRPRTRSWSPSARCLPYQPEGSMTPAVRAVLSTVGGGGALAAAAYFSPTLFYVVVMALLVSVVGIVVIVGCVIHRDSDKPIERVMRIIEAFLPASKDPQPPDPVPDPPAFLEVPEQPALRPARPHRRSRRRPSADSGKR